MNKKTDKLIDAIGRLDEQQIASCMQARRRRGLSGKARIALVLAAALLITTLASALIIAPMMLGEDTPGTLPGGITDTESTAPDNTTEPELPPNVMEFPGVVQLLSLGTISYSGYTVADDGVINLPSKNGNASFTETDDYFTAAIPIITLKCGAENTVKISCDYGVVGEVRRVREYGEYVYMYVDDNGGSWGLSYCSHFGDNELTVKGNESFLWYYAAHSGYSDTGCNRDTFIDYTVYDPEGEIIAAGSIYVAAFRYLFAHDLTLMTSKTFDQALSNFQMFELEAAQYTIRKPINLYAESFLDENGEIDTEKREAFFAYHDTIKSIRSTASRSEWIDTSQYVSEEAGYDISGLARESEENWVNPYAYDFYGDPAMEKPTEDVLAGFDEKQVEYYEDFLARKQAACEQAEQSFTSHDLLLTGFAKLCNDHLGFHPWNSKYSGVSCGTMAIKSEYMVFEVRGYIGKHDDADWWLVINDQYYSVIESSNEMREGEEYHFVEHYILEEGVEVYFYFSDTLEDKIEVIYP